MMNTLKMILINLFLLPVFSLPAQDKGVNFQHISFAEAIEKAKTENKLIFPDCYTSWCGPCKYMADKVFVLEKAGDYFNTRFVNLKIDMEKEEGKELSAKFSVAAFPTFLLIDAYGNIRGRVEGAGEIDDFILRVEKNRDEKLYAQFLRTL